jgi:hypothetical protein
MRPPLRDGVSFCGTPPTNAKEPVAKEAGIHGPLKPSTALRRPRKTKPRQVNAAANLLTRYACEAGANLLFLLQQPLLRMPVKPSSSGHLEIR